MSKKSNKKGRGTSNGVKPKLPTANSNKRTIYLLLGVVLLITSIIRIHLIDFPFERDEGEYAYMAKLMLDGHAPYTMAYNMKLPGTSMMYSLFMLIFGASIKGIHLGLLLVSMASIFLIFKISTNFFQDKFAVIAAASYALLSTSQFVLGQAAHATHFVSLFVLLGVFFAIQANKHKGPSLIQWFVAGICFALAIICKQSGIAFSLIGLLIIFIYVRENGISKSVLASMSYVSGLVLPIGVLFAFFYFIGDFSKFKFWTFDYLRAYGTQLDLATGISNFKASFKAVTGSYSAAGYVLLWMFSILGTALLFKNIKTSKKEALLVGFAVLSFLSIVPGFYFRSHYYITLLPAVAIIIGYCFSTLTAMGASLFKQRAATVSISAFCIICLFGLSQNKQFLFEDPVNISAKKVYGSNPFVEALEIGKYIQNATSEEDFVAVLGSEPEICFYADRYSASGYIYTYNLMENHDFALNMQNEMIAEIVASQPKFLIYVDVKFSWLKQENSEDHIINWATEYVNQFYEIDMIMEINPAGHSYLIDIDKTPNYKPSGKEAIYIYKRKVIV